VIRQTQDILKREAVAAAATAPNLDLVDFLYKCRNFNTEAQDARGNARHIAEN
jgi:hypothetical protein